MHGIGTQPPRDTLVAVTAWATFYIQYWFWSLWVRAEQAKVLDGTTPAGKPWAPLIGMGMMVVMVLLLVCAIGRGDLLALSELLANPGEVIGLLIPVFGGSLILAAVARWLKPEPLPSETPDR